MRLDYTKAPNIICIFRYLVAVAGCKFFYFVKKRKNLAQGNKHQVQNLRAVFVRWIITCMIMNSAQKETEISDCFMKSVIPRGFKK